MKFLHSADWHLDSPILGRSPEQTRFLKDALLEIPGKVADLCRTQGCSLLLLSGDIFDGPYTKESLSVLRGALEEAAVPTFITPGNHDFSGPRSPWESESWPQNVHVFTKSHLESVSMPELGCRIYGAGYASMDCPPLLDGFRAKCEEPCAIGMLHSDPTQMSSPYCPITAQQVQNSGLAYLALGHIHKSGSFQAGDTLCAWPGCPMGRGFDELGEKGVLLVTLEDTAEAKFLPLDTPRFLELEVPVTEDPHAALSAALPPVGRMDFFRVTLTGEWAEPDTEKLAAQFSQFPNLELRDRTVPPMDLWSAADEDSLEGVYFRFLRDAMEGSSEAEQSRIRLAARISRQILMGQEVKLP